MGRKQSPEFVELIAPRGANMYDRNAGMVGWPVTKSIARKNPSACMEANKPDPRDDNISRMASSFQSIATGWTKRSRMKTRPPQESGFNTSNCGRRIPIQDSSVSSFHRRRGPRCSASTALP